MFRKCLTGKYQLTLALLFSLSTCCVGDIYVTSGQSIQTAIDSSGYGDTIYVAAGDYIENITLKNGTSLIGADPNTTIIDGDLNGSVVTAVDCDPNTLISGFTLTNGNGTVIPVWPNIVGGGMYIEESDLTVNNCIFLNNNTDYNANSGGGLYNDGGSPLITDCVFSGNISIELGGGLLSGWVSGGNPQIINCIFKSNYSGRGGGMLIAGGGVVTDCIFIDNSVWDEGGGAMLGGGIVNNCIFIGNRGGYGGGGGLSVHSHYDIIMNCTFIHNFSDSYGAAIYAQASKASFLNCIVWGNSADGGVPDEISYSGSAFTGFPTFYNCNIRGCGGSGSGWNMYSIKDGGGNIDADPLYIDPNGIDGVAGTIDDNLRLAYNSPCIDTGDNTLVTFESDFDGRVRILDGNCDGTSTVDMGAYEYKPLQGDVNDNCAVGMTDLYDLASVWLEKDCVTCQGADLNLDRDVTIPDFGILAADWLKDLN